ncbi:hypothetical protein B0H17DRAFT_1134685 [Mycena rosella]|uniref:Uncharacterized protein n=1 Tax=Mycena rosella TaxID=1033263 RepID=A0AAD7DFQ0_MYCRO|nr:hypothetical protein B0H17DRAFT_1134685 [Mycena rosella]
MTSALKKLAHDVPHLERLSFGRSPWNEDHLCARETSLPSVVCLAILASLPHLMHLNLSVAIESDAEAVLADLLPALAAAPQLQYVGVDVLCPRPVPIPDAVDGAAEAERRARAVGCPRGARADGLCTTARARG